MRSYLYNRAYTAASLRNPDGDATTLEWVLVPLDAEARAHMAPRVETAAVSVPEPGAEYLMHAGTGKVLTEWLSPIEFPGPGSYEAVLVYRGAAGGAMELRSNNLVFRVR